MNKNNNIFTGVSLRPYQQTAVDRSLSKYNNGHRYSLVTLAVGLGKSWIMVFVALQFKRVVVLQPCIELVKQNHEKLYKAGLNTTMIDSAHKGDWSADYIYTTPQTLCKHLNDLDEPDLLIVDECFTGDTLVQTTAQQKRLDSICVGDKIMCATGVGTVDAVTQKYTNKLYKVRLSNGKIIKGTGNHPIFTERGWTRLDNLEIRENVFSIQDMPSLWAEVPTNRQPSKRITISKQKILQSILLKERQPAPSQIHRQEKRNRIKQKIEQQSIYESWREWSTITSTPTRLKTNSRRRLGLRICCKNWALQGWEWLSNLLQDRRCKSRSEDWYRNRWAQPSITKSASARRKEDNFPTATWVEDIQIEEQRVPIPVFNLQVSGHPSYFANGVLVHNCNVFWSGKMFTTIFRHWTHCKVLALTATPHYYERRTIYKHGWMCSETTVHSIEEQYEPTVMCMTRQEGHDAGYCPDIKFTKIKCPQVEAFHLENRPAYKSILDEHLRVLNVLLQTLNNGIIFCDSKAQAEWLSEVFNIPCIFGDTPKATREKYVEWFNQNEIPFVLTVGCLVRGFDKPDLENIVMLSNYNNSSEAEQIVGRLNRGTGTKHCYYIGRLNLTPPTVGETSIIKIKRIN